VRRRFELTDWQYKHVQPLISGKPSDPGRTLTKTAVLQAQYVARRSFSTDLPKRFGKHRTVYQRLNRWTKEGGCQVNSYALKETNDD